MNTLKYSQNVEKMLQYLHDLACRNTNADKKPVHLLYSLLHFEECTLSAVLSQNQVNISLLKEEVEELREKEPNIGVSIGPVPNGTLRKIYTEQKS